MLGIVVLFYLWLCFPHFQYLWSIMVWQSTIVWKHDRPLTSGQKVNSNLTLHHNAYVIHLFTSHHVGILSHIITKGGGSLGTV